MKTKPGPPAPFTRALMVLSVLLPAAINLFAQTTYTVKLLGGSYGLVIEASDGNFYGTTTGGGANSAGSIFRVTPDGKVKTLYSFCSKEGCLDGADPEGGLVEGPDGSFYGTTYGGGAYQEGCEYQPPDYSCGTVFRITAQGVFTSLYSFCEGVTQIEGEPPMCGDGYGPYASLTPGANGKLYGITNQTLFNITPSGVLATLNPFAQDETLVENTLLQASDGNFYGINEIQAGEEVVKFPASGSPVTTYVFTPTSSPSDPTPSLIEGPDGELYGIFDTFFKITTSGKYTSLASVATYGTPVLAGDGNFYYDDMQFTTAGHVTTLDIPGQVGIYGLAGNGSFIGLGSGGNYLITPSPAIPSVVQLALNPAQALPDKTVTATLKVLNAFSLTMQQCYAFQNGTPLGKVPGTYNSQTKLYTFSGTISAPAKAGIYNYAVTCGGVESGFATLTVGDTTQTTLAAAPNPVTPPANVTLTATVKRTTASGTPGGLVTFSVGTTVLGKSTLNGAGVATLTAASQGVPAGTYPVTATYSGDTNDVSSTSAAVSVSVQ